MMHLPPNEQLALTVAGMSACLGAVVRAPITSILIVFEMTHQFAFVPLLMLGAIASQAVSRAFCHTSFYNEVLERDGIDLDQLIPIKSWGGTAEASGGRHRDVQAGISEYGRAEGVDESYGEISLSAFSFCSRKSGGRVGLATSNIGGDWGSG